MIWVIALIIDGLIWGAVCMLIVRNKGYENDQTWFLWGFLFSIFAVLVAISKPEYKKESENTRFVSVKMPFCGRRVRICVFACRLFLPCFISTIRFASIARETLMHCMWRKKSESRSADGLIVKDYDFL